MTTHTDKEKLLAQMLADAMDAIEALYGKDAVEVVVEHMKVVNRNRETNAEIDALEKFFQKGVK